MTDEEIMNLSCPEKDKLGMLFGNHLTHGSEQGGLICVNEFNKIIDVLIKWKDKSVIALAESYANQFNPQTSVIGKVMDGFIVWLQEEQT